MPFAFIATMGGVGFEDVAVARFQFFQDGGLVDNAGTAVVGERTEKNGATVLADQDRIVSRKWGLGDCNNKFVLLIVSKEGELVFMKKGELSEADKTEFTRS